MEFNNFIAEDQLIEIIPKFNYNKKLKLLCGEFGPFIPPMPVSVPIWLALNLKQQKKCEIIIPDWVKRLHQKLEQEMMNSAAEDDEKINDLELMNENWREILKMLESDLGINFRPLVERREAILKESVHKLLDHVDNQDKLSIIDVNLNNVTRAELFLIKRTVQECFAIYQKLRSLRFL